MELTKLEEGLKLIFYFTGQPPLEGELIEKAGDPFGYWIVRDTFNDKLTLIKNFEFVQVVE